MKAWLKGGLIGGVVFLLLAIFWWVYLSINLLCILEPIQSINMGGAECYFKDYFSMVSLLFFIAPIILGFFAGSLFGLFVNKEMINYKLLVLLIIGILFYIIHKWFLWLIGLLVILGANLVDCW